MVNGNQKGKRGEREAVNELKRVFGIECHRSQQYCGRAGDSDVAVEGLHVEVKRVESFQLDKAVEQATADAGETPWIVMHKKNRKPWLIVVTPENLLRVAEVLGKK